MTKKHFKLIAEHLNTIKHTVDLDTWNFMVFFQIELCRKANPRFDQKRFVAACNGLPYKK
jgi:hypothetical protein